MTTKGPTRDQLFERNARLALRLGQLATREHQRLHGRTPLSGCNNPDCRRTWRLLDRNAPDTDPDRPS